MDGELEGGDRRGRCRGGSGCREQVTAADALPATSPSLLMPDSLSLSLCHTYTPALSASKMIEARSLAPHQAQGVMTVPFFPHQPPACINTQICTLYVYIYHSLSLFPPRSCSLKCQAGGGAVRGSSGEQ